MFRTVLHLVTEVRGSFCPIELGSVVTYFEDGLMLRDESQAIGLIGMDDGGKEVKAFADFEYNDGADVAENAMPDVVGELMDVLVAEGEIEL